MITQTLAIFRDAYRELNAKKMFWIVLVLSVLVVAIFATVGVNNERLTFFGRRTPIPLPMERAELYRYMFTTFGIGLWLTLIATVLALISTASIFPDFISGGSIDLYLSKPISRLRLFLTKYAAGLLFAALQVFVFSLASFVVIGVRGGAWEPRVFLAVPLVVCFFSYLFCVSTLVGVLTRSTIAAVMLTALAWFLMFVVGSSELVLLTFKTAAEREQRNLAPQLKMVEGQIAYLEKQPPEKQKQSKEQIALLRAQREDLHERADGNSVRNLGVAHKIVYGVKTVLPKTTDTTDLMSRWLLSDETLEMGMEDVDEDEAAASDAGGKDAKGDGRDPRRRRRDDGPISPSDAKQVAQTLNTRPVSWVIGTSLGFEAVVLALAAWVFCRRDY